MPAVLKSELFLECIRILVFFIAKIDKVSYTDTEYSKNVFLTETPKSVYDDRMQNVSNGTIPGCWSRKINQKGERQVVDMIDLEKEIWDWDQVKHSWVNAEKLKRFTRKVSYEEINQSGWNNVQYLHSLGSHNAIGIEVGCYLSYDGTWVLLYDVKEPSHQEILSRCSSELTVLWDWCYDAEEIDVSRFPNLTVLDLGGCEILRLVHGITSLTQLKRLNLGGTQLDKVPDLGRMTKLQHLSLWNLPIKHVEGLENLLGLHTLDLSGTKIKQLPESIRGMRRLERLDLSNLTLEELPEWLPELGLNFNVEYSETGIGLEWTTVKNVDMSIFERSHEYILQWFEERKKTKESQREELKPLNEVKVILLGDGEAGKSHTIARLLNDGVQVDKFRSVSTPGIVIEDKTYDIGGREIKVHYWDFGGQEILHSMHRMFLTTRTLYVVMLNVREGNQDDRARYWLHNLRSFANGAPVLLVLNKMDMNKNASVNESDLRELYPGLTDIVKLSTLAYGEQEFRQVFLDVLLQRIGEMDILALPLTSSGRSVKEKIQNMQKNYIHGDIFRKFCDESGVTGSDVVRRDLLNLFSELGVSFCYGGSTKLEDYVVLRPDWITNAIYIILFNKVETVTNGLVTHDTIYRMLSSGDTENIQRTVASATYTREEVDYVLNVVRKFRLSFPVEDEATEFMPMLCDANSTAAAKEYENDPETLEFRMYYEYLPNNVIHRLMVDHRKELDWNHVWLTGARFVCGDTGRSAVVKSEGNLLRIFVRAKGEFRDPQRYLDKLKGTLERINEEMGLTVVRMEVAYKENGKTVYFDYEDLLFSQEIGDIDIPCRDLRKRIPLVAVLMQSDFPEDEKQKKLMNNIWQACEMLQEDNLYWNASEDQRTGLLAKLLRAKDYIAMEQHRTGISAGGIQSGELDLDIRLTPGDSWSAMEALNLTGSSACQIEYWNAHLKKLLDNYNHVGRSFLFHISYVECAKTRFDKVCGELFEHLRFHSPKDFDLQTRFVHMIHARGNNNQFVRAAKAVYDCGGIPMTVYHYFVRIGR